MAFYGELLWGTPIPQSEKQGVLDRVYSGPGIPKTNETTKSFWQKSPHPELLDLQSKILPETADVVIIGSGMTGTSVARTLLTDNAAANSNTRIVLLEARQACSGATGRNGGHVLATVEDYLEVKNARGADAAQKMVRFNLRHMEALMNVAEAYGIVDEAQVRRVQFISAHSGFEAWKTARANIEAFKHDMAEESAGWEIVESPDEIKKYLLPGAIGIIKGYAGAIWPYKFVTSILAKLRHEFKERFTIKTNTPVLRVTKTEDLCLVETKRGIIKARHVVHCTNGYSAHLLPELLGRVYPVRGQMSAQVAPQGVPNQGEKHSWLLNHSSGYEYLTQLPVADGVSDAEMMLGGGFVSSPFNGVREVGVSEDDTIDSNMGDRLRTLLSDVFQVSPHEEDPVKAMWTGIMGFSVDGCPWVGEVPEGSLSSQGRQWVAAGFSGEGMVFTWLCGQALAQMLLGFEQNRIDSVQRKLADWFPEEMIITEERLRKSKLAFESLSKTDEIAEYHPAVLTVPDAPAARL